MQHFLKHSWHPQAFHLQQGFDISLLIISHRLLQSGQFGGAIRFVRCSPKLDLHDRLLWAKEGRRKENVRGVISWAFYSGRLFLPFSSGIQSSVNEKNADCPFVSVVTQGYSFVIQLKPVLFGTLDAVSSPLFTSTERQWVLCSLICHLLQDTT